MVWTDFTAPLHQFEGGVIGEERSRRIGREWIETWMKTGNWQEMRRGDSERETPGMKREFGMKGVCKEKRPEFFCTQHLHVSIGVLITSCSCDLCLKLYNPL